MLSKLFVIWTVLFAALGGGVLAQAPQAETIPFTVWLDFHRLQTPGAPPPSLPIWLSAVTTRQQAELDGTSWTVIRIQLRALAGFDQKRLLQLFFDDVPGA